jgi:RNA 2',3'-cyclic 3'-phosphodiesterase
VFVVDFADAAVGEVLSAGAAQYGQPFELILDIVGCWKHNGIAWAAPARVPPPLLALVEGLESRLRAAGFELENRRYRPHVTLLRRAECRPVDAQPGEPLRWMVDRFVLVRSRRSGRGSDYERLAEWQLKPDISRRD